jgi:hypothetical protein
VDRNAELNRLAQADRHIADAEPNVSDQLLLIEKLRRDGHDIRIAEETLKRFEASLHTLREHRHLIVTTIEQIDKGLA